MLFLSTKANDKSSLLLKYSLNIKQVFKKIFFKNIFCSVLIHFPEISKTFYYCEIQLSLKLNNAEINDLMISVKYIKISEPRKKN